MLQLASKTGSALSGITNQSKRHNRRLRSHTRANVDVETHDVAGAVLGAATKVSALTPHASE